MVRKNTPSYVKELASKMRRNPTCAETLLWEKLRGRQVEGYRFYRQRPIVRYIPDFYCHELKLVIELDGEVHNDLEQQEYDNERDKFLNELGIEVMRFKNEQVICGIKDVLLQIQKFIRQRINGTN